MQWTLACIPTLRGSLRLRLTSGQAIDRYLTRSAWFTVRGRKRLSLSSPVRLFLRRNVLSARPPAIAYCYNQHQFPSTTAGCRGAWYQNGRCHSRIRSRTKNKKARHQVRNSAFRPRMNIVNVFFFILHLCDAIVVLPIKLAHAYHSSVINQGADRTTTLSITGRPAHRTPRDHWKFRRNCTTCASGEIKRWAGGSN